MRCPELEEEPQTAVSRRDAEVLDQESVLLAFLGKAREKPQGGSLLLFEA